MNVEGLACFVVGIQQCCVAVVFTDEHPEALNGLPVALIRGCTPARDQAELARLLAPGADPVGVQLYVEPDTMQAKVNSLWMAGFRVRLVRASEVFSVPGWWHLAAHRHHTALTRGVRCPPPSGRSAGPGTGRAPAIPAGPPYGGQRR
jgi:hypothetical protein